MSSDPTTASQDYAEEMGRQITDAMLGIKTSMSQAALTEKQITDATEKFNKALTGVKDEVKGTGEKAALAGVALKFLNSKLSEMVALASPATVILFTYALRDLAAVIGQTLIVPMMKATDLIRALADEILNLSPKAKTVIGAVLTTVAALTILTGSIILLQLAAKAFSSSFQIVVGIIATLLANMLQSKDGINALTRLMAALGNLFEAVAEAVEPLLEALAFFTTQLVELVTWLSDTTVIKAAIVIYGVYIATTWAANIAVKQLTFTTGTWAASVVSATALISRAAGVFALLAMGTQDAAKSDNLVERNMQKLAWRGSMLVNILDPFSSHDKRVAERERIETEFSDAQVLWGEKGPKKSSVGAAARPTARIGLEELGAEGRASAFGQPSPTKELLEEVRKGNANLKKIVEESKNEQNMNWLNWVNASQGVK